MSRETLVHGALTEPAVQGPLGQTRTNGTDREESAEKKGALGATSDGARATRSTESPRPLGAPGPAMPGAPPKGNPRRPSPQIPLALPSFHSHLSILRIVVLLN